MSSRPLIRLIVLACVAALSACALAGCMTVKVGSSGSASSASSEATSSESASTASGDASSAASSTAASTTSASSSAASGSATSSGKTQKIGNPKVGYVQVPASWEDHTNDLGSETIDAYAAVYYVDPSTKYSSTSLGHDSYAKAIQLTVAPTSYKDTANQIISGFKQNTEMFSGTDASEIQVDGKNAILITTLMTKDKLQLATIVIDRDGDGHASVGITMNCGMDQAAATEVLAIAKTWTL